MSPSPKPTTSSYAVAGLLALRPWTAYDLTKQMARSLRFIWPRSERHGYDEPKRLVALGWAKAKHKTSGGRTVAEYRVTADGRRALREWLATRPAPPVLECEVMLRLIHADHGTKDQLVASLQSTREDIASMLPDLLRQVEEYATDGGPFPERLHVIALYTDFYARFLALLDEWSEDAIEEVERWQSTTDVGLTPRGQEIFAEVFDRFGHPTEAKQ